MQGAHTSRPQTLTTVQSLRGLAALLVLFLHTAGLQRALAGPNLSNSVDGFWNRGFSGVDIFFVISGFIMVYVTRDLQNSFKTAGTFISARIRRIYPLWWFYAALWD